jgi:predicted dienelactone hydrolase
MFTTFQNNSKFIFPKLSGPYKVGTISRYFVDESRKERHDSTLNRELMTYFYYPAQNSTQKLTRYFSDGYQLDYFVSFLKSIGYPESVRRELENIFCHSIPNAVPVKNDIKFPVIIFSPADGALFHYTALCEQLASHGYIVVAIAHTYDTQNVLFPDGRVIDRIESKTEDRLIKQLERLQTKMQDVSFVIDQLEKINTNQHDEFYDSLNLNKIGMLGHSSGGLAALRLLATEPRIQVAINLDGEYLNKDKIIPELNDAAYFKQLKKPFLFIMSDKRNAPANNELSDEQRAELKQIVDQHYQELNDALALPVIEISGLTHMGFTDHLITKEMPYFKAHKEIDDMDAGFGLCDGFATIKLINEYVLNFFNQYLKNKGNLQ